MSDKQQINIYFSDFFEIDHEVLNTYGALDISLISDNPAFVDPFLIFYSDNPEYKALHQKIVEYMSYLHQESLYDKFDINNFLFPEVKQVWLGFSKNGNNGQGLGKHFANQLNSNLSSILKSTDQQITQSAHMEKLCLVGDKVGADKISDFTLNLIKDFLVTYTENFAQEYLDKKFIKQVNVPHCYFDYENKIWVHRTAKLPFKKNQNGVEDYVLLVPKDILVKNTGWISKNDYLKNDISIINRVEDLLIRTKINRYFLNQIPSKINKEGKPEKDLTKKNKQDALRKTTIEFPILLDYYIKYKEDNGNIAINVSQNDIHFIENLFYKEAKQIISDLQINGFYEKTDSYQETKEKINILKSHLEDRGGWKLFWDGKNIKENMKENDVQILIDLVFNSSDFSVDREVNNGSGPVDHKISKGKHDSTLIEVKLAKNSQLKKNLKNQLERYLDSEYNKQGVYVIVYFNKTEFNKVTSILSELEMSEYIDDKIFLIDCSYKLSASKI